MDIGYSSFSPFLLSTLWFLAFAIAGGTDKISVGMVQDKPELIPSCQSVTGKGVPAVRIESFVSAFGKDGYFNVGTDSTFTQEVPINICSDDYSPALRHLGRQIVAKLGSQCVGNPPLTRQGGLACHKGTDLGQNKTCTQSCLEKVDCIVEEVVNRDSSTAKSVPRCADALFSNPNSKDCGSACPCWRIVPSAECLPSRDGSPWGFEILRKGEAPKGSTAAVKCNVTSQKWGSEAFAALPQCT